MAFANRAVLSVALSLGSFVSPISAQGVDTAGRSSPIPIIEVSAEGQVDVAPDRATIAISVQTRAGTAAASGQQNARIQRAVTDTLRALGIAAEQISTTGYQVYPEYRQERVAGVERPTIIGYNVTNTVRVQVRKLEQIGSVIDASLAKGANMITSLDLYASNTDQARRTALALAVERARADAEALARAAGGSLGALLELSTATEARRPIPMRADMAMRAQAADTPISLGTEALVVHVNTRWRFVEGRR